MVLYMLSPVDLGWDKSLPDECLNLKLGSLHLEGTSGVFYMYLPLAPWMRTPVNRIPKTIPMETRSILSAIMESG